MMANDVAAELLQEYGAGSVFGTHSAEIFVATLYSNLAWLASCIDVSERGSSVEVDGEDVYNGRAAHRAVDNDPCTFQQLPKPACVAHFLATRMFKLHGVTGICDDANDGARLQ